MVSKFPYLKYIKNDQSCFDLDEAVLHQAPISAFNGTLRASFSMQSLEHETPCLLSIERAKS